MSKQSTSNPKDYRIFSNYRIPKKPEHLRSKPIDLSEVDYRYWPMEGKSRVNLRDFDRPYYENNSNTMNGYRTNFISTPRKNQNFNQSFDRSTNYEHSGFETGPFGTAYGHRDYEYPPNFRRYQNYGYVLSTFNYIENFLDNKNACRLFRRVDSDLTLCRDSMNSMTIEISVKIRDSEAFKLRRKRISNNRN